MAQRHDDLVELLKDVGGLKPETVATFSTMDLKFAGVARKLGRSQVKLDRAMRIIEKVIESNGGFWCDDGQESGYQFPDASDLRRVGDLTRVAELISEIQGEIGNE